MNRRKFLAALGTAAAGGSAVLGTGAFTSVSAGRSVSVSVADDANALLALRDETDGEIVRQNGLGQLVIDFAAGPATGVNANARVQIGTFGNFSGPDALTTESRGAYNDPAFNIVNRGTQPQQVTMSYDGAANNCLLAMQMTPDGGREDRDTLLVADDDTSASVDGRPSNEPPVSSPVRKPATVSLGVGERAGVAIFIDTGRYDIPRNIASDAAKAGVDLSGTLTITATGSDN
jgi:hypothetical protein